MSVFYSQLDYEHVPYLSPVGAVNGNIANNGCGICSAAMVAENMLGVTFPPEAAARFSKIIGARETWGTDLHIFSPAFAGYFNLKMTATMDSEEALRFLQEGRGMIIANTQGDREADGYLGVFSNSGHYIVIAGAEGRTVKVWDPMYRLGSDRFELPHRKDKVRLDGTDAYADISVLKEDCKDRYFFMFEKKEEPAKAPLIGVTCGTKDEKALFLFRNYMKAILNAGGIPVALSLDTPPELLRQAVERLDGMLITGGLDVDPARYGQEPHPKLGEISPERDELEISCAKLCRELGKPVVGICRGMQVIAAAFGGTLYQDLPDQKPSDVDHFPCRTDWHIREAHTVTTVRGTRFEVIAGGEYSVNSYHHQAVEQIPEGFRVAAVAPDGVIEAFEACEGPLCLGVQWHPERLEDQDPKAAAVFEALIMNARKA